MQIAFLDLLVFILNDLANISKKQFVYEKQPNG